MTPLERSRAMLDEGAPLWEEYADLCEAIARSMRAVVVLRSAGAVMETLPHLLTGLKLIREKAALETRFAALNEKYDV